jgi:hypothetical protein
LQRQLLGFSEKTHVRCQITANILSDVFNKPVRFSSACERKPRYKHPLRTHALQAIVKRRKEGGSWVKVVLTGYVEIHHFNHAVAVDVSVEALVSDRLLEACASDDPTDLERCLQEFGGVDPLTVNMFLRELREVLEKAGPSPSEMALETAEQIEVWKT